MGLKRVVAFSRRHVWAMSAVGAVTIVCGICGIVIAVEAMINGSFIAGYLGAAACGDVLIWGVIIMAALWLPRKTAPTT